MTDIGGASAEEVDLRDGPRGPAAPRSGGVTDRVPVRAIVVTIALVLVAAVAVYLVIDVRRVLVWIVVAAFFAVALHPLVWRGWSRSWCATCGTTAAIRRRPPSTDTGRRTRPSG